MRYAKLASSLFLRTGVVMAWLTAGMIWLNTIRGTKLSESVDYDTNSQTITINALRGSSTYDSAEAGGVVAEARSTDFIVSAADLVFALGARLPQEGDKIRVTVGGVVSTFEVLASPGGTHYKPLDGTGLMLRIHTRLIDVV